MRGTVLYSKKKNDFTEITAKSLQLEVDLSMSADGIDGLKSVSIDSLEFEKLKIDEKLIKSPGKRGKVEKGGKEVVKEAELEMDLNALEGGRSARLCTKLKKISQEKELLRQVNTIYIFFYVFYNVRSIAVYSLFHKEIFSCNLFSFYLMYSLCHYVLHFFVSFLEFVVYFVSEFIEFCHFSTLRSLHQHYHENKKKSIEKKRNE
jgi:hypothetical protein